MKTNQQLSILGAVILLVISSCAMQKRVYNTGYNVEWLYGKNKLNKTNSTPEKNTLLPLKISVPVTNTVKHTIKPNIVEQKMLVLRSKPIVDSKKNPSSRTVNNYTPTTNPNKVKPGNYYKRLIKNKLNSNSPSSGDSASGGLRTIGFVSLAVGLIILLFVSILIGALLMLMGLIFVIAGGDHGDSSSNKKSNSDKSEYIDVLYLKNGSVIRGIIIEQIPNLSIKIQTMDGSIFVYKMEEVEKITKELAK